MTTLTNSKKAFIKAFNSIAPYHHRYEIFRDFIEMAYCALAKTTQSGDASDKLEARYMEIVGRHKPEDIRKMPELLGIAALAIDQGGSDFIGSVVGELELLSGHIGQFFSPYELCRLMAEMQLSDVGAVIEERGFVTVSEPACGAAGMVLAAADVIASKGYDISQCLYVEAVDIAPLCFHMAYVQLSLRGIPAVVRHGNSLSLEMFESARTPALLPFLMKHGDPFPRKAEEVSVPISEPSPPAAKPVTPTVYNIQLSLF